MIHPELSMLSVSSGRARVVLEKLAALTRQLLEPERFELVLVDNACPERVGDAVQRRDWPFAVRVVRTTLRESAARARCLALGCARAPIVWLCDDDCLPAPDAAQRHLAHQRSGPSVVIGSLRFVTPTRRSWARARRADPLRVSGANTSLPRDAMRRACEADVRLPRAYGGEDIVLGLQLQEAGLSFVAAPEAAVDHLGPDPMHGAEPSKGYDAGYNAVAIARRWPRAAWGLGVHPVQVAAKRLVLASPEALLWRKLAPGRVRYERAYLDGSLQARRDMPQEVRQ